MFRSVESKYYDDFLFKPMVNGKQKPFFRHMKNISGKQAKSRFLSIINELETVEQTADSFNNYFRASLTQVMTPSADTVLPLFRMV
ncbi:hypothetical protein EB796_022226 [Bugula neritina]|uniref:Uncharacterized protein n=1 Tax=Bugula neritina TaxID=10212 RepID=A0A7J7J1D3_BUGNE|nr:hypothetical protein EB796_022226 [Bugula neritina]